MIREIVVVLAMVVGVVVAVAEAAMAVEGVVVVIVEGLKINTHSSFQVLRLRGLSFHTPSGSHRHLMSSSCDHLSGPGTLHPEPKARNPSNLRSRLCA